MKIVHTNPPEQLLNAIKANGMFPHSGVIFTYGDTIYNPSGNSLPDHLVKHEETHCTQQGDDPDAWWGRYLTDQYFRIEQEAKAYAKQFAFICKKVKDRNQRFRICTELSRALSGHLYGNIIGQQNAYDKIKKLSNIQP